MHIHSILSASHTAFHLQDSSRCTNSIRTSGEKSAPCSQTADTIRRSMPHSILFSTRPQSTLFALFLAEAAVPFLERSCSGTLASLEALVTTGDVRFGAGSIAFLASADRPH